MARYLESTSSSGQISNIPSKYEALYKERYINKLDLRPGRPMHDMIVGKLMKRATRSARTMSTRHDSWRDIDHYLTAYVKLDEKEKKVRENDYRKPVSLVIPTMYAIKDVLVTYMIAAFLDELPYFRYTGVEPGDAVGAKLLEKVIAVQCEKLKVGLSLATQFGDAWSYGIAPVSLEWVSKYGKRRIVKDVGRESMLFDGFVQTGREEDTEDVIIYEGTQVENIDPYLYLPDTNVPVQRVQEGEYVGWLRETNRTSLLSRERHDERMFNVRYIPESGANSRLITDPSGRGTRSGMSSGSIFGRGLTGQVDMMWMCVDLIPSEWEAQGERLGDSDYPEKWMFGVAGDGVLIYADPLEDDHGMFPVAIGAPTYDGYSVSPISGMEMISELQGTIDWMISSHITNVRKSLNDMFVVDPLMINMNDFANPGPGKIIRTRKSRWGMGVKDAVEQLRVDNVTEQHMRDIASLMDIAQRILGVSDNMQGMINPKRERVSADETEGARNFGMSRQASKARLYGEMCLYDIAYIMAKNTQQYMSQERYFELQGEWVEELSQEYGLAQKMQGNRISVNPFDIFVDFDISMSDRAMPGMTDVRAWDEIFKILMQNPAGARGLGFDLKRIAQHTFRQKGAKNVTQFFTKPQAINQQVAGPDEIDRQRQAGNIVPIQEAFGG